MSQDKHPLQDLCEVLAIECRSYRGRFMYGNGKECLGVQVDALGPFIASIISGIQDQDDDWRSTEADVIAEAFNRMETDSIGLSGTIVYFPDVQYVDEKALATEGV